jgi:hypothetical protein
MSLSTSGGQPPAGWYPIPDDQDRQRWWDGSQWGADTRTTPQAAPVPGHPVGIAPSGQAPEVARRGGARAGWALALGIGAFVLAWVPFLGIVLAAVGLLLAVLELVSGTRGARVVWATVLSTVALLIGIAVTSAIALSGGPGTAASDAVGSGLTETGDGKPSPGSAAADEAEAEPKPADEPKTAGLGDPVRDGKLEFTVTKIETGVSEIGDEYFGKEAQGQFLLVHVKVENIGDEAQTFFGENLTALDADDREFSADTEAAIYLDESNSFINEINPGNTVEGIVVFDVPKDTKITALELHDSFFSGGVTVKVS